MRRGTNVVSSKRSHGVERKNRVSDWPQQRGRNDSSAAATHERRTTTDNCTTVGFFLLLFVPASGSGRDRSYVRRRPLTTLYCCSALRRRHHTTARRLRHAASGPTRKTTNGQRRRPGFRHKPVSGQTCSVTAVSAILPVHGIIWRASTACPVSKITIILWHIFIRFYSVFFW